MLKKACLVLVLVMFLTVLAGSVRAQEFNHVISNSEDWRDVYSILMYGDLKGAVKDFLVSPRHAPILLTGISKTDKIRIISSSKMPFALNYAEMMRSQGFTDVNEVTVNNANLELINDLPDIKNFIIVGNTYGYDGIAVAPYAAVDKAWVFFADRVNIAEIDSILSARNPKEVIVYGFVDRSVKDTLAKYNPKIIDKGDRFENDIEITKEYLKIKPTQQVLLSNGEFIENELLSGSGPVLFTGKETVPDQIKNYIKSSDIEVGVLIGADLVGSATNIRRDTGISVIVKFARGARDPTSSIAPVEGLDLFYLPTPIMDLQLYSAKYNRATSQLEVTYKSNSNIPIYFKGTLTPQTGTGQTTRIGDVDPIFIAPDDYKTVSYPDVQFNGENMSLGVFTLYGEAPSSLEKMLEKTVNVEIINVLDRCKIEIKSVTYSKPKSSFVIKIQNIGETDCWVDAELNDVVIDRVPTMLGSKGSVKISAGKSKNIVIEQEMTDDNLKENPLVEVTAYFGEREDSLINAIQGKFKLNIETISLMTIGLISLAVIVIVIVIILFIILKRRRKDDDF
jgi:hypothetical protein